MERVEVGVEGEETSQRGEKAITNVYAKEYLCLNVRKITMNTKCNFFIFSPSPLFSLPPSLPLLLPFSSSSLSFSGLLKMNETSKPKTDSYFSLRNMKKCNIFLTETLRIYASILEIQKKAANQAEGQKVTD